MNPSPLPITAVVLARDGADTLERCLSSLSDFAEVLLYDNGSTDATLEIAARFANVRIIKGHFDGFGPTRNRAAREAKHDWIFNIDTDEWLTPVLQESLRGAPLSDLQIIYTFTRRNLMFGHVPRSILGRELIHRLYHRDHVGWEGKVHEYIVRLDGAPLLTKKLRGELWHDPYRSVGHLFQKRWIYAQPSLRDRLKPRHPALAVLRALWRFLRSYVILIGFIDGWRGFVVSAADAYGVFLKYVWAYEERTRNRNQ